MLGILGLVLWLGCIICFIMVLIKLFQNEGALKGKKIGSAWRITRSALDEFLKS